MQGLSLELYRRVRNALLDCDEFESDTKLRSLFVIEGLYPFRRRLPEATSPSERVDKCLEILLESKSPNRAPVLPLFISVLRDRYEGDDRYSSLEEIRVEIETKTLFQTRAAPQLRRDLGLPWQFDLRGLTQCYINELIERDSGLIGFVIPSDVVPRDYLRERLINTWRGSKFAYTCHTLKLHPVTLPTAIAVKQIAGCCEKVIKQGVYSQLLF